MAKSARSSTRKANNQQLKKNVFGPVEEARAERLSAKLLELASQPKTKEAEMEDAASQEDDAKTAGGEADDTMEIDSKAPKSIGKKKIEKRRKKKSSIVFPKYKDRTGGSKKK